MALACAGPASAADFAPNAVAFLQKHCVACHGEKKKSSGIALHIVRDDAAISRTARPREGAAGRRRRRDAAEGQAAADRRGGGRLLKAVADAFDHADNAGQADPGRVTIRRLNRAEYNNTIRDLVGVDFKPAEDFPSDDVGYGFDNIGDVLSLSPLLMEKYLAAAEAIVAAGDRRRRTAARRRRGT